MFRIFFDIKIFFRMSIFEYISFAFFWKVSIFALRARLALFCSCIYLKISRYFLEILAVMILVMSLRKEEALTFIIL